MQKRIYIIAGIILFFYLSYNGNVNVPKQLEQDIKTVEIKGEVVHAGVYDVPWDATIHDVINQAGGTKEDADISSINLNYNIEHQGVIVIPLKKEEECISINSASREELDQLPGVGEAIANRIIAYRQEKTFQSLDEIKEVKGIGDKMFEKIKGQICL